MSWSRTPYLLPHRGMPFPFHRGMIPHPLFIHPPKEFDSPMDLSVNGKSRLPTPPPTPDTPLSPNSSSGCQSPRFNTFIFSRDSERTFDCKECDYTTRRRTNLKRHIQSMHSRQEKVECCGSTFHSKAEFRAHVKDTHQNGYKCELCSRSFCRKALLKRHMSVHNGIKEFCCKLCSYATSHKSNLERHQRVHSRQNCNMSFNFNDIMHKMQFSSLPKHITSPPPLSDPITPSDLSNDIMSHPLASSIMPSPHSNVAMPLSPPIPLPATPTPESADPPLESAAETVVDKHELDHGADMDTKTDDLYDVAHKDRLLALRVAAEEVLTFKETSKMMPGSQRLCPLPYKCVLCVQRFKTQQALTLHEIHSHPNRRADAFLSFPLKYQLKIVYNAMAQKQEIEDSKHDEEAISSGTE